MARSTLFRTVPTFGGSLVVVRDLDGKTPVTLFVECASHKSTTVNDEVVNAGLVYTAKVFAPVHLWYEDNSFYEPNGPLIVATVKNGSDYYIQVRLARINGVITSTARDARAAILQHRFDPFLFEQVIGVPPTYPQYIAPDAGQLVYVDFIPGDTGSGLVTAVDSFTLGTDPDSHTSAPSSGFPSTGACTVEVASSPNGPWIVDTTAGTALSTVGNNAVKEYSFVNRPMVGLRVTVVATGTQCVVSGIGH